MTCPHCDADVVAFAVPPAIRDHAPGAVTAICTRCLRTFDPDEAGVSVEIGVSAESDPASTGAPAGAGSDAPDSSGLSAVDPAFPDGDAGVALALTCGHLESFALNRASIETLVEYAEESGTDALAFLDRLDAADAAFDLDRRRAALLDVL